MKNSIYIFILSIIIYSCGSTNKTLNTTTNNSDEEIVVIENDSLEYKIIITDIGFSTYLVSIAKPIEFYSLEYLETKNYQYVVEWNSRASNPIRYGDFYGDPIDYSPHIHYGLEVNYKLFNYFEFVEHKYKIRL